MQPAAVPLENLRAEIDRIDQALLELLIERIDVVRRIGDLKQDNQSGRLAVRPAREAQILRRLVADAGDRFPPAVLVRMWREMLAALTRLQAPLSATVCAPLRSGLATWDLARDHFGSLTAMTRVDGTSQAVRAVVNGTTTVAVLPLPCDDDSWWTALLSDQPDRLRVFMRLPFVAADGDGDGDGDGGEAQALAVGRAEIEPSGDDLGVLAIEASADISRGRLRDLLAAAGLEPTWLALSRSDLHVMHVAETASLALDGDPRLEQVQSGARGEILRIVAVGGYPRPVRPAAHALTPAEKTP
jgi:chorismate mutase / prephenate dehydratase